MQASFGVAQKVIVKKNPFKNINLKWWNFIGLTIAGFINAIGVCLLLSPLNIYDGGFSGTSVLINKLLPEVSMAVWLLCLNIPFFLIGNKKIGVEFLIYSLYAVVIYSFASFLINNLLKIDFTGGSPVVGSDVVLGALFGGPLSGVGSGLVIKFGGALDGVEVMALLFHKRLGISVGAFVMIYNAILFITAAFIFESWVLPLYSLIAYFVGLKTIDFIVEGFEKGKAALIITQNPDELAAAISEKLKRGITIIDAVGYYSGEDKKMLYVVVNWFEIARLKDMVNELDKTAFVSIIEVSEILGTGKMYRKNK